MNKMMGYKDQTWCSRYSSGECTNDKCWLALTRQEKEYGFSWWGGVDFHVMMGDRRTEGCGFVTGEPK